jgi:hypothetical protein
MVRGTETDLLGQRKAEDGSRLAVVGQPLPGCAVDQRVEIGQAAQSFAGNGTCQCGVGRRQPAGSLGGIVHRLTASKYGIKHPQGDFAGINPFLGICSWTWHVAL